MEVDPKISKSRIKFSNECISEIVAASGRDARAALNILETIVTYYKNTPNSEQINPATLRKLFLNNAMVYDKKSDEHYHAISALHKSMRNSDPDAAVYWLARMLEAGEDPLFIARRLIRFASEDIGLACNNAMQVAVAAYQAVHFIGMPECSLSLTQAVIYFSILPKSNSLYKAYEEAKSVAQKTSHLPVPLHLRNAPTKLMASLNYGKEYQYAHDYENTITSMDCMPEQLNDLIFYNPTTNGNEKIFKEQLENIKKIKEKLKAKK